MKPPALWGETRQFVRQLGSVEQAPEPRVTGKEALEFSPAMLRRQFGRQELLYI